MNLNPAVTKKYELGAHMTDMIYTRVCALVPWCVCRRYKKHSITIGMLLIILYYFFDYYLLCRLYYYTKVHVPYLYTCLRQCKQRKIVFNRNNFCFICITITITTTFYFLCVTIITLTTTPTLTLTTFIHTSLTSPS